MIRCLFLLTLFLPLRAPADEAGVRVVDGDGLRVGSVSIRLWGVDAPELEQTCKLDGREVACGQDARFLLSALVMGGRLACETKDVDRYGRTVARCAVSGVDLGGEMVRQGYALDYTRYSGGAYAREESEARAAGRGVWAGEFIKPWDWRRRK